jgi:heme-degrading monooxygenase HmoA
MVHGKLNRINDQDAFESAFTTVSNSVLGTPGHVRDELLRDSTEPGAYILMSEWLSQEAFLTWETSPIHMQKTLPLRPYWKGVGERKILEISVRVD